MKATGKRVEYSWIETGEDDTLLLQRGQQEDMRNLCETEAATIFDVYIYNIIVCIWYTVYIY